MLVMPLLTALLIQQAFQFGKEIAFEEARRSQRKMLTAWRTELRKLQDEVKRLELENTQLKKLLEGTHNV